MADFDIIDDGYNKGNKFVRGQEPTIDQLRTAISGSAVTSSYPTAFLNAATKNDLIAIVRQHQITVAGVILPTLPPLEIFEGDSSVEEDDTLQLTVNQPGVTWDSSADAKATVSSSGLVTGVAAGTAEISAAKDGFATASITITVTAA